MIAIVTLTPGSASVREGIRYDPRDIAEIRVFHQNRFLCRAVSPDFADRTISLRELQAARTAQRRALRGHIEQRRSLADQLSPPPTPGITSLVRASEPVGTAGSASRLRRYRED